MARSVWEALENNGAGVVSGWPGVGPEAAAKLDQKLDMLRNAEVDAAGRVNLPQDLLAGPGVYQQKWIYKLKVKGQQALRPMLCLGPQLPEYEWTVLARATERDRDTRKSKAAAKVATVRRKEILERRRSRRLHIEAADEAN